jgi:hypothetical protein
MRTASACNIAVAALRLERRGHTPVEKDTTSRRPFELDVDTLGILVQRDDLVTNA